MRRSRFANRIEVNEVPEKASVSDALCFDITAPQTSDEESLSEWRLAGMQYAPLILGVTHLMISVAYIVLSPALKFCWCFDNPLIPSVLAIAKVTKPRSAICSAPAATLDMVHSTPVAPI